MKIAILASIIGLTLVAVPSGADAQGCRMGHGPRYGGGIGMMGMRGGAMLLDPSRLSALKEKLAITADQEAAWSGYAEAVKGMWNADSDPWKKHAEVWGARDKLQQVLTADQRQQFDQSIPMPCLRRPATP